MSSGLNAVLDWVSNRRMEINRRSIVIPGLGLMLACVDAQAANTYIFNESPAHQCFKEADKRAPPYGLDMCDLALDYEGLTRKDRAATFSNRGVIHRKMRNFKQALRDQDSAIRLEPELSGAHINRGNVLMVMKRYAEAMQAMTRSIEIADENLPLAYYNRAMLFRLLGDSKSARADAARAAELDPLQKQYETLLAELGGDDN